ncbi:hypothetical protein SK128_023260 [Halocaridina rubra]|uniref:FDX-ACB domain-containing protein n=1 Tax=Halocaridina rubra TaxID=373956 RepID=A0AAN8X741_HALRR
MEFSAGSTVLFVGEGNFSFTESLCQQAHLKDVEVVTSCFQKNLSDRASATAQLLKAKGIVVLVDVDATKLEITPYICDRQFSSVVFNFPHVGGKMKIHLNRTLLLEFFKSAAQVLKEDGQIIVTLCGGQGGIPLDPLVRKWSDSWQIVYMASRADLVLRKVEKFEPFKYYKYSATGYRSVEKSFHQEGAFIYIFEKSPRQRRVYEIKPLSTKDIVLYNNSVLTVPTFIAHQLDRHLHSESTNVIGRLFYIIQRKFATRQHIQFGSHMIGHKDLNLKDILRHWNPDLYLKIDKRAIIFPIYILKKNIQFRIDIYMIIVCFEKDKWKENLNESIELFVINTSKTLTAKQKKYHLEEFVLDVYEEPVKNIVRTDLYHSSIDVPDSLTVFAVDIMAVAQKYYEVDEDEIWSYGQTISENGDCVTYSPYSLFPLKYVYDLSFWHPFQEYSKEEICSVETQTLEQQVNITNSVNIEAVFTIITNITQDVLVDFEMQSTYFHSKYKRRSSTLRLTYRSYYSSLSDIKAKKLHAEIGLKLEEELGVEVRW